MKAIITHKSNLDRDGNIRITFNVYNDDVELYSNMYIYGNPTEIMDLIRKELERIKKGIDDANAIEIPTEITI